MAYTLATAHKATRSDLAATQTATRGFNGTGVSVAVIDSGIDGTHPFFSQGGASKVVANLKNVCGIVGPLAKDSCFQQVPTNDTDTLSGGGHGTHVAGIAAGVPSPRPPRPAPGCAAPPRAPSSSACPWARPSACSTPPRAQNWVLEHQRRPCAPADQQDGPVDAACPPIRVTNHSYGPVATEGEDQQFDAGSVSRAAAARAGEEGRDRRLGRRQRRRATAATPPPTPTPWTRRPAS